MVLVLVEQSPVIQVGWAATAQGTRSSVLAAAVNLSWRVGTAMAILAPVLGLILARPIARGPDVERSARGGRTRKNHPARASS